MTLPIVTPGAANVENTELQAEIRQAIAELDSGDCMTMTIEELERWAATGEPPWPHESTE